jgi:hypothetical protein
MQRYLLKVECLRVIEGGGDKTFRRGMGIMGLGAKKQQQKIDDFLHRGWV